MWAIIKAVRATINIWLATWFAYAVHYVSKFSPSTGRRVFWWCARHSNLRTLDTLDLRGLNLTRLDDGAFGGIQFIRTLDLSDNKLIDVSNVKWPPTVEYMYLDHNLLETIPTGLPVSLISLKLNHNRVTTIDHAPLARLSNLTKLSVNSNLVSRVEPDALHGLKRLTALELGNNRLIDLGPNVLPRKLRYVILDDNQITTIPSTWFHEATHLYLLSMRNNPLEHISPEMLPWKWLKTKCFMLDHALFGGAQWYNPKRLRRRIQMMTRQTRRRADESIQAIDTVNPRWCTDIGKYVLHGFLSF